MADVTFNSIGAVAPAGNGFVARVRTWMHNRAEYRRTLSELRNLDRRTLDDLGIAPSDIEAIARGRMVRG
ncbi:MAG: DUF1127 domain-containing protein [Alphaproteobacteria bacterium]